MPAQRPSEQGGVALLEALIAILIFSFGIIGLVGAQAAAIKSAADAKLRTDASYLAGQIISRMWGDRANLADYAHFTGGSNCSFTGAAAASANVTEWLGSATLPGTVGYLPNGAAQIVVDTGTNMVTVTVCWRAPQETVTHNYASTALISG